jgi:hypothetical protein
MHVEDLSMTLTKTAGFNHLLGSVLDFSELITELGTKLVHEPTKDLQKTVTRSQLK